MMLLGMSGGIWFILILLAMVLDACIGDPVNLPHPIVYIGKFIGFLAKKLNHGKALKLKGLFMWCITLVVTALVVLLVQWIAWKIHILLFYAVNVYFLATTIAAKCLKQEVYKVYDALKEKDLEKSRTMVGYLVGRDTQSLDEHEIIRATVETTAENTIDGVLAPIFFMLLGCAFWGFCPMLNPLVLAMGYKAINTMDSMVGYIQEPFTKFGFFPAKLDDVFNFVIARIGSWLMIIGGFFLGYDPKRAAFIYKRDKNNHKSPNSGHPESVVAGLLGVQLGGTNRYFGQVLVKPTIGDDTRTLTEEDIRSTVSIMYASEIVMAFVVGILFLIVFALSG